jgi:hypothetical protein
MRRDIQRQLISSKGQIKAEGPARLPEMSSPRPSAKESGSPPGPDRRNPILRVRRDAPIWSVLGILAPVIVAIGLLGVVVGLVAGQSVGIIALDALVAVVGGVLLLILRWR